VHPNLTHGSSGRCESALNGISIDSDVFAGLTGVINTQADHATSVAIARIPRYDFVKAREGIENSSYAGYSDVAPT